jgi:uncharacterized protein (TIGR02646 family)
MRLGGMLPVTRGHNFFKTTVMRKINKDFTTVPDGLKGDLCGTQLNLCLTEMGSHEFKSSVYRHETVLQSLKTIYSEKCAFCESDTSAGAPMQVEHYRPKAKVSGADALHPGYYWLGYEWSNLLLACASCNNKKRNKFPLKGIRVSSHPVNEAGQLDAPRCLSCSSELLGEQPLLLNPEVDSDPMAHFIFLPDGSIEGSTPEGETTKEVCGLNRDALLIKRKQVYDGYLEKFARYFERHRKGKISEETLLAQLESEIRDLMHYIACNKLYTEFARRCLENFQLFFVDRFETAEATLLARAYNHALEET